MAQRFDELYRVNRRDNLGDPDYWNLRFRDIDRRIGSSEQALADVDVVAKRVESVALDRINNVVTPLVAEVITRLQSIANLFRATSASEVEIGTGTKTFVIAAGERNTFAAVEWVTAHPLGDDGKGVIGSVVSYDAETGALVLNVGDESQAFGAGTFDEWELSVALPPELTTLTAVRGGVAGGRDTLKKLSDALDLIATAVEDEAVARDAAIANAITALKAGVGTALDTLDELAAALGDDANFAATMTTALGNRLRVDAAQGLSAAAQKTGRENIGLPAAVSGEGYRLVLVDSVTLKLMPRGSGLIRIAGILHQIPAGGVTVGPSGTLVALFVYARIVSGAVALEIDASAHQTDTTAGNIGTEIKAGDNSRTLVGQCYVNDLGTFADAISWLDRRTRVKNVSFSNANTSSTSRVSLSTQVNVLSFGDEAITVHVACIPFINNGSYYGQIALKVAGVDALVQTIYATAANVPVTPSTPAAPGEGYVPVSIEGLVSNAACTLSVVNMSMSITYRG